MSNAPDPNGPPCACGHGAATHYNATGKGSKFPCHHRGKHDTRCRCGNYEPAKAESILARMEALTEVKRTFSLGQTILAQMEKNLASNLKDPSKADEEKYARQRKVPSSRHIKGATERPPLHTDGSQKAKKRP